MKKRKNTYFILFLLAYIISLLFFYQEIAHNIFLFALAVGVPLFSTIFLFIKIKALYKKVNSHTKSLTHSNFELQQKIKEEIAKNEQHNKILLHQSKMAAMGEMISNIAHQWRQPLSAISTAASAMKLQKELKILSDETFDYSYNMIMKNSEFLSETINSFRDFFALDKEKSDFDLEETINRNIDLINNRLIENNIKLHTHFEKNITLFGYKNEFMQVIINLLNNAIDALKVKSIKENKIILIQTYTLDNQAIVVIHDNGDGIKESIKDKIFEPYFTTKHQAQGTGIGLYMTQEIIVNHMNGNIKSFNESFELDGKKYYGAKFQLTIGLKAQ
ncbi:MAG: HAMP domain-containing sensor histidine kinase [Sulfurimonadaceae bacterium]